MISSFALMALLLAQLRASGSTTVEVSQEIVARVDYGDQTGTHPEVAGHGKRLIRQMWASMCGQDGRSCSHGPYTVSLTITETDMGLYCLANIAGKPFDKGADGSYKIENVWLRCSLDGTYHVTQDAPQIKAPATYPHA